MKTSVDDPVAFAVSPKAQAAVRETIAHFAGPEVIPINVALELVPVSSEKFATGGLGPARRLLGLVDVFFEILVSLDAVDIVVDRLLDAPTKQVSNYLSALVVRKGRPDLTGSIFVQQISASERQSTTTTTKASVTICPPSQLCYSASCESCHLLTATGLECQKMKNPHGDCVCSCFETNVNHTLPGPPKVAVTGAATRSGLFTLNLVATVAALVMSTAARRLA